MFAIIILEKQYLFLILLAIHGFEKSCNNLAFWGANLVNKFTLYCEQDPLLCPP